MREVNGFFYPDSDYLHHEPRWRKLAQKLDVVWEHVRCWETAVDAGAYAGYWAAQMAERFGEVYAFEPIFDNALCVRRNCPDNVTTIHMAVADRVGRIPMTMKGANYGQAADDGEFTVQAVTIDSFHLQGVGFLKLDVEHLEPQALDGAAETIERCRPVICVETKWNREPIAERLERHGYTMIHAEHPDEVWVC